MCVYVTAFLLKNQKKHYTEILSTKSLFTQGWWMISRGHVQGRYEWNELKMILNTTLQHTTVSYTTVIFRLGKPQLEQPIAVLQ